MQPPVSSRGSVLVASDHRLVGETLCAALASRGFEPSLLAGWPPPPPPPASGVRVPAPRGVRRPDIMLLVCDLDLTGRPAEVRAVGRARPVPWLVLTQGAPDVAWGAVLDAGARAVMGPDLGLDDLVSALETVRRGGSPMSEIERQSLLRRWRAASGLPEPLWRQLARLSPEEGDILTMLYEGTTVRAIADRYGISEAAVRTQVQSVLRRLASHL